jgi:hypothetical protein
MTKVDLVLHDPQLDVEPELPISPPSDRGKEVFLMLGEFLLEPW